MKLNFILFVTLIHAQVFQLRGQSPLTIKSGFSPEYLISNILLSENPAMTVSNVNYTGHEKALGAFSNSSKYYIIKRGIILSTGWVEDGIGPNQYTDKGEALGTTGNQRLEKIVTEKTYDASELSFDFIPEGDSINFKYVFVSEEYPEFVDKGVNDVFAFFIEDLESHEIRNLAVVGREEMPVNVDNINHLRNIEHYIENGIWDTDNVMQWAENPGLGELALTYEYDGFTSLLTTGCSVIPGKSYRISFSISDVGDRIYDSAVLLEGSDFRSISSEIADDHVFNEIKNEFSGPSFEIKKDNAAVVLSFQVNFDFDQFETKEDSTLEVLSRIGRFLKVHNNLNLNIVGYTDNWGDEVYNLELSEKRAEFAYSFIVNSGIDPYRLTFNGMGEKNAVAENITGKGRLKNRRIEFEFRSD